MLKPKTLITINTRELAGPRLQAGLETLIGMHLQGTIQAALITSEWKEESYILGFYQAYPGSGEELQFRRRVTGGRGFLTSPSSLYAGFVFASESLEETVKLASRIASCTKANIWGATRFGPRPLATGVIEFFGLDTSEEHLVSCIREAIEADFTIREIEPPDSIDRIYRAYTSLGWIEYRGASNLPLSCSIERDSVMLRLGFSLTEDKFISLARIDGTFMAAPPNEPYNLMSSIEGMPVSDVMLDALEIRGENQVEWYGVNASDIAGCARRLFGERGLL